MPDPIDIVLPCYNPNTSWPDELMNFHRSIEGKFSVNYIVVNDGSVTGNVHEQVGFLEQHRIPVTFLSYSANKGKGYALRQGVQTSTARYVVYTDIDFPFTNQSMHSMLHALTAGEYDIVAGYRNENYYLKKISVFRKILSKSFRFFIKNILRIPITDTQCGLKGFNGKGKSKFLATRTNRYLFDFEFIYSSVKDKSVTLGTVPVALKDDIVFSKMRLKILIQEAANLLRILIFKGR